MRVQLGLLAREATSRLTIIRKDATTFLAEHATEIKRLVGLAHPDIPDMHKRQIRQDTFHTTLGNACLQRHLLEVAPLNIDIASGQGMNSYK